MPDTIEVENENGSYTIRLRRNERAKRYILRVPTGEKLPVLTVPKGGKLETARDFAKRQIGWLEDKLEKRHAPVSAGDGNAVPFRGIPHDVLYSQKLRGGVQLLKSEEGQPYFSVSGDPNNLSKRLVDFLKKQARQDLEQAVDRHAKTLGKKVATVSIRDTKSRWGSCTSDGRLSFSWRLILAPPEVLDYVAAHEVAHLVHMNHSPDFWQVCTQLAPHTPKARRWLNDNGARLHRYF
nr:SprT family zinc-dependent metalloprotease [Pseudovibrio flavus]